VKRRYDTEREAAMSCQHIAVLDGATARSRERELDEARSDKGTHVVGERRERQVRIVEPSRQLDRAPAPRLEFDQDTKPRRMRKPSADPSNRFEVARRQLAGCSHALRDLVRPAPMH
jgi:hypothetical protein